jgi:hypothetical protein
MRRADQPEGHDAEPEVDNQAEIHLNNWWAAGRQGEA